MTVRASLAALAATLLLLGGCDYVYTDEPEPETPPPRTSAAPPPPASPGGAVAASGGTQVVVRAGQTLYAISREQNVPVRALIDANDLQPPYGLKIGQVLIVPRTRQYVVQPGDTLYGIARRTNAEAATLARLNHLEPPYILKSGAALTLPPEAAEPTPTVAEAHPAAEPPPAVATARAPVATPPPAASTSPGPAVPVAGGTIMAQSLAPPPGAKPATAQPSPAVPPPSPPMAAPVQTATLPPTASKPAPLSPPPSASAVSPPSPPPPVTVVEKPAPAAPEPAKPPPAKPLPPPEPEVPAAAPAAAAPVAVATTEDVAAAVASHRAPTSPLFYWPVRGKVLSVFGPAAGGTYNDGINIGAPDGAQIAATESGVVAYAGEMSGYGNLLLIKHADGWVSAYAHTSAFLVQKGEHVRRGQAVAKVGSSGGIGRPQLHFELRQGRTAVDPLDHLPPLGGESG
ncbi:MAG TPA: peptidoglycan DD-metalloendopeptidase family protein [Stellaceae bacterium]|nr:peptidoglycan DD-metalloendopeptidase family protein [Stellaceae bacterium]